MMNEYRFAERQGGPRILRFLGAALLGAAAIVGVTLLGAPGVVPVAYPVLGLGAAVGLALVVVGQFIPRDEFILSREGLHEGREGRIVPWGEIASGRLARDAGPLELFSADGREVASIPTHLPGIDHLALLLVDTLPVRSAPSSTFVRGKPSHWRRLLLYGGALGVAFKAFSGGPGVSTARGWVGFGILIAVILAQVFSAWRRSGEMKLALDAQGVNASDRFGNVSARWGEIEELTVRLASFNHDESPSLTIHRTGVRPRRLSLAGMDLVAVLSALRAYAPVHWARLVAAARQGALPPAIPTQFRELSR